MRSSSERKSVIAEGVGTKRRDPGESTRRLLWVSERQRRREGGVRSPFRRADLRPVRISAWSDAPCAVRVSMSAAADMAEEREEMCLAVAAEERAS